MANKVCFAPQGVWAFSSAGRAPPWHGGGHRFDPDKVHQSYIQGAKWFPFFVLSLGFLLAFFDEIKVHVAISARILVEVILMIAFGGEEVAKLRDFNRVAFF